MSKLDKFELGAKFVCYPFTVLGVVFFVFSKIDDFTKYGSAAMSVYGIVGLLWLISVVFLFYRDIARFKSEKSQISETTT